MMWNASTSHRLLSILGWMLNKFFSLQDTNPGALFNYAESIVTLEENECMERETGTKSLKTRLDTFAQGHISPWHPQCGSLRLVHYFPSNPLPNLQLVETLPTSKEDRR